MNGIRQARNLLHRVVHGPPEPPDPPLEIALVGIQEPFRTALTSSYTAMRAGSQLPGSDGKPHSLDGSTLISTRQGMWMFELVRRTKPKRTLEIGLAYGFSTCYILAALNANGAGEHVACDPSQISGYHGIGLQKTREVGMEKSFRWIEELSNAGIPRLAREGLKFEFIYIDGNHRFDDALVDFTLCDLICADGGHIILDDMWMPSIQKAAAFLDRNRTDYTRVQTPVSNIAVFQKTGSDERAWNHFVDF